MVVNYFVNEYVDSNLFNFYDVNLNVTVWMHLYFLNIFLDNSNLFLFSLQTSIKKCLFISLLMCVFHIWKMMLHYYSIDCKDAKAEQSKPFNSLLAPWRARVEQSGYFNSSLAPWIIFLVRFSIIAAKRPNSGAQ